ncbi:MAG: hypothetical protein ABEK50_15870 [bacterium]
MLAFTASPALAGKALHYQYQDQDGNSMDYWFSRQGIRISSEEASERTIIYQPDRDAVISLNPNSKEAVILEREAVKNLIQKINQILKQMRALPPKQRQMMKQAMGDIATDIKDVEDFEPPELVQQQPVKWRNMSATKGVLVTGSETAGEAIILEDPPIKVADTERQAFKNFQDFLVDILRISDSVSQSLDITSALSRAENIIGDKQFRLAEFRSGNRVISLKTWERKQVARNFFDVPEDYSTRKPSFRDSAIRNGTSANDS